LKSPASSAPKVTPSYFITQKERDAAKKWELNVFKSDKLPMIARLIKALIK
jgi:hypothetical protein